MHEERRFPVWVQFACVAGYFGTDLFLRFSYQAVLGADINTNSEYGDEEYVIQRYSKPAFMVLCGYVLFFFWGPLLVWPYLKFVKKVSVVNYYQTTWSGDLEFREALRYTCIMGCILFLGNLGYVAGLRYINVALASALSQGEAPFTVALSVLFLHRVFGMNERIGICLSFAGIALIAVPPVLRATDAAQYYGDDDQIDAASSANALDQIGGILSTLIGALGFGFFQVFWPMFDGRRFSAANPAPTNPGDAIIDTFATLSLVGAFCYPLAGLFFYCSTY
jgi:drug/metabolite transporter (DMT)-like permease